nr:unnamed protein product [Callosobruchus chinensis]
MRSQLHRLLMNFWQGKKLDSTLSGIDGGVQAKLQKNTPKLCPSTVLRINLT